MQVLYSLTALLVASLTLIACGGGSNSSGQVSQDIDEPTQLTSSNWSAISFAAREVTLLETTYSAQTQIWSLKLRDDSITQEDHIQVFLNTDNNPATGFQFDGEAWSQQSGADYMIEDDILFESTANDSSWGWKNIGPINFSQVGDTIDIAVPVNKFKGLCSNYALGTIGTNTNWEIESFYPTSNNLLERTIAYCDTTSNQRPVITLNGNSPLSTPLNSVFVDPGATASDAEDGDISANIQATSTVNTSTVGIYKVTYNVKDSNTLSAVPITRDVIVTSGTSSSGITIDGSSNDWASITPLVQANGSTLKVSDDQAALYFLITSNNLGANTQLFIDSDGSSVTGLSLSEGSADYMVENSDLSKHIGTNNSQWAWNYTIPGIAQVRNNNVLEMSVLKSALTNLTNTPKVSFTSRNQNWQINYELASSLTTYTLTPLANNTPDAVEDVADVDFDKTVTVNVLANDTDPDGDTLTVTSIVQPPVGVAVLNTNGTIFFDPQNNIGSLTVSYTISDGNGGSDTATLTVSSTDPNDGNESFPDITNENVTTPINTPIFIDVLANDTDADGDVLILDQVDQGVNGTTTKINGGVLYTPNPGFTGTEIFYYGVHDGHGHNGAGIVTVTITP